MSIRGKKTLIKNGMKAVGKNKIRNCCDGKRQKKRVAGVDNRNIRDMFRLMTEFSFDFIINSQVLWGDCDTLDALAIYQLIRPENAKFVTVMPYVWNGHSRELMESEDAVEQRRTEIEQSAGE